MFKRILFATAASPACNAAAKVAFELAEKYTAKLTICHVFSAPSQWNGFKQDLSIGPDYATWIKDEIQNTYTPLISQYGMPEISVLSGMPSDQILDFAAQHQVDCIIMGAHTREDEVDSTRFRGVVGATLQQVARKADCPVLTISRACDTCFWYFNRIILGTDFSPAAMHAFDFAFKMARTIGSKLYLFHAPEILSTQAGVAPGQKAIEDRITAARKKIETEYVSRMGDFDNYDIAVWEGMPHVELLKFARINSADLIVMGHHTRGLDPDKAFLGTTVEQVVLRSACPVASVNHPA